MGKIGNDLTNQNYRVVCVFVCVVVHQTGHCIFWLLLQTPYLWDIPGIPFEWQWSSLRVLKDE